MAGLCLPLLAVGCRKNGPAGTAAPATGTPQDETTGGFLPGEYGAKFATIRSRMNEANVRDLMGPPDRRDANGNEWIWRKGTWEYTVNFYGDEANVGYCIAENMDPEALKTVQGWHGMVGKVKEGMSPIEVRQLLGPPTKISDVQNYGIEILGYTWVKGESAVTVMFFNGRSKKPLGYW